MYKVAVMGDYESIYGFAALGLETFPVTLPDKAKELMKKFREENYGIVYVTEGLAAFIRDEIERYRQEMIPAVVLIPGAFGNTGEGVENVKRSVEQAVGSDILFGEK